VEKMTLEHFMRTFSNLKQSDFFVAHAVRARGSAGHQNVLWSVNYSQVVENRRNAKSRMSSNSENKQQTPKPNKNQHNNRKRRHPVN